MEDGDNTEKLFEPQHTTDWDGPDDKMNPQNWSLGKRVFHTCIPASVGFLCPFGSSVYTPGHMQVMQEFGVSRELALLPFSFYLLGLSLGPVIAAPISETFGRKVVYLSALPIFAAFTVGSGFSRDIASLIVCRFLAGLFSSPGLSIGTGTISDLWPPEKRGAPIATFITLVQMAPALGPLIGGIVTKRKSWRWTQWVVAFGIVIVILLTVWMSETYKAVILKRKAKKNGFQIAPMSRRSTVQTIKLFATKTITRPLHMLLTEPIVTLFDIYIAFNFGLINAFFAGFSWVFMTVYNFDLESAGLTYLSQAVGSMIGFLVILYVLQRIWVKRAQRARSEGHLKLPPEHRLLIAQLGAPLLPISLFWFGWTARSTVHWIVPVIVEALFSCGNMLVFTCSSLYLTDCYGALYGASAWSSNTFLRYLFGCIFPLFTIQMYEALGAGWATSLLGFISCLLVPIPFAFDRYGRVLRERSRYSSGE